MTMREKIIISLALVMSLLYAVYYFEPFKSPEPEGPPPAKNEESPNEFLLRIGRQLKEWALPADELYVLVNFSDEWKNPFPALTFVPIPVPPIPPDPKHVFKPVYSGFLESGDRRIAILDHMEYEVGDQIVGSNYRVITIMPGFVTLGGEGIKTITVKMPENE